MKRQVKEHKEQQKDKPKARMWMKRTKVKWESELTDAEEKTGELVRGGNKFCPFISNLWSIFLSHFYSIILFLLLFLFWFSRLFLSSFFYYILYFYFGSSSSSFTSKAKVKSEWLKCYSVWVEIFLLFFSPFPFLSFWWAIQMIREHTIGRIFYVKELVLSTSYCNCFVTRRTNSEITFETKNFCAVKRKWVFQCVGRMKEVITNSILVLTQMYLAL